MESVDVGGAASSVELSRRFLQFRSSLHLVHCCRFIRESFAHMVAYDAKL